MWCPDRQDVPKTSSCELGALAVSFTYRICLFPNVGVLLVVIVANVVICSTGRRIVAIPARYTSPTTLTTCSGAVSSSLSKQQQPRVQAPTSNTNSENSPRSTVMVPAATGSSAPHRRSVSKTKAVATQSFSNVTAYLVCFLWSWYLLGVSAVVSGWPLVVPVTGRACAECSTNGILPHPRALEYLCVHSAYRG